MEPREARALTMVRTPPDETAMIGPSNTIYTDAVYYFTGHGTLMSSTAYEVLSEYPEFARSAIRESMLQDFPALRISRLRRFIPITWR
jgi:hypothetical protein